MASSSAFNDSSWVVLSPTFDEALKDGGSGVTKLSDRRHDRHELREKSKKTAEKPKEKKRAKEALVPPTKSPAEKSTKSVTTKSTPLRDYPKGSFFCLGNEFAERFSFFGMRAILTLYMKNTYAMSDNEAKVVYHAFVSLAYFTPLLGSILADGCLGRYRVILYISVLYCVGHVILTTGAVPQFSEKVTAYLDFVGLFVIAVGTGGIKPCVSSFAADQFPPHMTHERRRFAALFYFSITFGSLLAEAITPRLSAIPCLGKQFCYPLAFGLPAVFVFLGFVIFWSGKRFYKIVEHKENTLIQVAKCSCYALRKVCSPGVKCPKDGSFMDLAKDKYDPQLVEDVKLLGRNVCLFIPAISFWALFDQQGSSWVLQANRMDGHFGVVTILPDQLTFLNPLFVILMLPIFILVIYPFCWARDMLVRPLRRMGYGCIFAILSFIAAGIVQLFVNKSLVVRPQGENIRYVFVNMADNPVVVNYSSTNLARIQAFKFLIGDFPYKVGMEETTANKIHYEFEYDVKKKDVGHVIVFWKNCPNYTHHKFLLAKPNKGQSAFHVIFHPAIAYTNISVLLTQNGEEDYEKTLTTTKVNATFLPRVFGSTKYDVELMICDSNSTCLRWVLMYDEYIQNGGVYCLLLDEAYHYQFLTIVKSNNVSMAWMIPQYFLITVGEIMFAISGSEFSYAQAAYSMKSTWQACWLTSVAVGNTMDVIVAGSSLFENAAIEYFFYACVMALFTFAFVFLARQYKYVDRDKVEAEKLEKLSEIAEPEEQPVKNVEEENLIADNKGSTEKIDKQTGELTYILPN